MREIIASAFQFSLSIKTTWDSAFTAEKSHSYFSRIICSIFSPKRLTAVQKEETQTKPRPEDHWSIKDVFYSSKKCTLFCIFIDLYHKFTHLIIFLHIHFWILNSIFKCYVGSPNLKHICLKYSQEKTACTKECVEIQKLEIQININLTIYFYTWSCIWCISYIS